MPDALMCLLSLQSYHCCVLIPILSLLALSQSRSNDSNFIASKQEEEENEETGRKKDVVDNLLLNNDSSGKNNNNIEAQSSSQISLDN
jgi:hypothetical protein